MKTNVISIVKTHIVGEIFSESPTLENQHPFDFFMSSDIDSANFVGDSALGEEWGFETCEQYGYENIRSLRGLMQSMLDDLLKLQTNIFQSDVIKRIQINKDEFQNDSDFYDVAQYDNSMLHRQGTNDEHVAFLTISWECVS